MSVKEQILQTSIGEKIAWYKLVFYMSTRAFAGSPLPGQLDIENIVEGV